MGQTTRRTFIRRAAGTPAGAGAIGLGNQGADDMTRFLTTRRAQVAWLADPDDGVQPEIVAHAKRIHGRERES